MLSYFCDQCWSVLAIYKNQLKIWGVLNIFLKVLDVCMSIPWKEALRIVCVYIFLIIRKLLTEHKWLLSSIQLHCSVYSNRASHQQKMLIFFSSKIGYWKLMIVIPLLLHCINSNFAFENETCLLLDHNYYLID